jgi:hypothetical protein
MTDRIIGPSGGRRRRRTIVLAAASVAALGVFMVANALAVHDVGFELEGNAITDDAALDDWDEVCHEVTITNDPPADPTDPTDEGLIPDECESASDTNGATAVSWTADGAGSNTIFTGGGSKDPQDITNWAWKNAGGLPQKDNLLHSFAARYTVSGSEYLFFGSDRFANDGDAQQGFWFFQDEIALGDTPKGGGTSFEGVHEDGDLLVISDFSNGGTTSTITVYEWDSSCLKGVNAPGVGDCGDANLRLLATSTEAKCGSADPDDQCGIVNEGDAAVDSPWSFTDTVGSSDFRQGEFFEGGVNLTALDLAGECFASVASESRSSTSTTATLKDFVLGEFGRCGVSTAQKWLPNDTATVTGGVAGTVDFKLYVGVDNCDAVAADEVITFADRPIDSTTGTAETNNDDEYVVTTEGQTTISWSATFKPTGQPAVDTETCEASTVTITNDAGAFPPEPTP